MKRELLLLCLFIFSQHVFADRIDSLIITSPEGVGKHMSELLINRGDIRKSPVALDVKRLFSDIELSKIEDSPAELIFLMLYGQQIILPYSWDELLFQADSLKIGRDVKYEQTYFIQLRKDQFLVNCVLYSSSKYYTFMFITLESEGQAYVMRFLGTLREYNSVDDLKESICELVDMELLADSDQDDKLKSILDSSDIKEYNYDRSYILSEIENVSVVSPKSFVEKLTETMNTFSEIDVVDNDKLKGKWKDLLVSLKEKDFSLSPGTIELCKIPCLEGDSYNIIVTYTAMFDSEVYTFSCIAILINEKWNLIDISPLEKESAFRF